MISSRTMAYVQANILLTEPPTRPHQTSCSSKPPVSRSPSKPSSRPITRWRTPADILNISRSCWPCRWHPLVLRGGAGHGRSERSDGTKSPGTILHSQEAIYAGGPPAGGSRRRACPRAGAVRRRTGARAGGVKAGAKEESAGAAVANKSCCA